jgi:hypothetical protein
MASLRKLWRLPGADRKLLIKAALLLVAVKLGMRLLPFRSLRRLLARVSDTRTLPRPTDRAPAERITWAVEVASRRVPGAKGCLTQALAAQVMLTRRGCPALLHIGVARGGRGRFQAHAWVESEGKVVVGGPTLENLTPLAVLEGKGS